MIIQSMNKHLSEDLEKAAKNGAKEKKKEVINVLYLNERNGAPQTHTI